jgi:hypothetical protein
MDQRESTVSTSRFVEPVFIEFTEITAGRKRKGLFKLDLIEQVRETDLAGRVRVVFEDWEIMVTGSYNDIVRKLQMAGAVL